MLQYYMDILSLQTRIIDNKNSETKFRDKIIQIIITVIILYTILLVFNKTIKRGAKVCAISFICAITFNEYIKSKFHVVIIAAFIWFITQEFEFNEFGTAIIIIILLLICVLDNNLHKISKCTLICNKTHNNSIVISKLQIDTNDFLIIYLIIGKDSPYLSSKRPKYGQYAEIEIQDHKITSCGLYNNLSTENTEGVNCLFLRYDNLKNNSCTVFWGFDENGKTLAYDENSLVAQDIKKIIERTKTSENIIN